MANPSLRRSLPILIRPSHSQESQNSLGMNISETSTRTGSTVGLPTSTWSSARQPQPMHSTGWQSLPATPPPELNFENGIGSQLMDGIGCLFPAAPPSRAQSLTMESETATDGSSTPRAGLESPDLQGSDSFPALEDAVLDTPLASAFTFRSPISLGPPTMSILQSILPPTPGVTPYQKRASSPPPAPRPVKRPKLEMQYVHDDFEDEGYSGEDSQDRAFHNARQLTIDLVGKTGFPIETLGSLQENFRVEKPSHAATRFARDNAEEEALDEGYASGQTKHTSAPCYALEIEYFTEDEIEEHLAGYLSEYRAFYLEPDEEDPSSPGNPVTARRSRRILKTIFESQLTSAENEEFLLQDEEEDVLDVFMMWIREQQMPSGTRRETFEDLSECLEHLRKLSAAHIVKQMRVSITTPEGSLLMVHLPARSFGSTVRWNSADIHDVFCGIMELDGA